MITASIKNRSAVSHETIGWNVYVLLLSVFGLVIYVCTFLKYSLTPPDHSIVLGMWDQQHCGPGGWGSLSGMQSLRLCPSPTESASAL